MQDSEKQPPTGLRGKLARVLNPFRDKPAAGNTGDIPGKTGQPQERGTPLPAESAPESILASVPLTNAPESILACLPEAVMIFNADLNVEYSNTAMETLTGLSHKDAKGKNVTAVRPTPRSREASKTDALLQKQWDRMTQELAGYAGGKDIRHSQEGVTIQCYQPADPLNPNQQGDNGGATLQEIFNIGDRVFVYQFFKTGNTADDDLRIGLMFKEITEQKNLQDQFAMAEKLSGLGRLSAGLAHEINNPLYSISGFAEAIMDEKDLTRIHTFARKILDNTKRASAIIQNLAGFDREGVSDPFKDVNVNERLDAAIEAALQSAAGAGIKAAKNYGGALPTLRAKPGDLQQIFGNIIVNAVQAMHEKGGQLTVTSAYLDDCVVVTVADTGPGIPAQHLSKIFDPFFTTKDQGMGSGLGLNIVHRMLGKYNGRVKVESEVGKGSKFTVFFPVHGQTHRATD